MDEHDCLLQMKTTNTAHIASFPGSPLTLMKNENEGGEPGTNLHVISQHDDFTLTINKLTL